MNKKTYIIIGYSLLALFLAQEVFDVRWQSLMALQQDESYKRWSGLGLLVVILTQWTLTLARANKTLEVTTLNKFYNLHKWLGAFSPLFFYLHTMQLGFMYLFFLSVTYFTNLALGFTNLELVKKYPKWVFQLWMIFHVGLSMMVTSLTLYHIVVVFYYE